LQVIGEKSIQLAGLAGIIDIAIDEPEGSIVGNVLIGHPHPLYGGSRDNKVVTTLARAFTSLGLRCWRPDFRGVGKSEGHYDGGQGETDDFVQIAHHIEPAGLFLMAGFSFGTVVATRAAHVLENEQFKIERLVLVGTAALKWPITPPQTSCVLIHGDEDEVIPLSDTLSWAKTHDQAVTVIPGADHFFNRKLTQLKALVLHDLAYLRLR
jgi:uncharacterized protein